MEHLGKGLMLQFLEFLYEGGGDGGCALAGRAVGVLARTDLGMLRSRDRTEKQEGAGHKNSGHGRASFLSSS